MTVVASLLLLLLLLPMMLLLLLLLHHLLLAVLILIEFHLTRIDTPRIERTAHAIVLELLWLIQTLH